MAHGDDSESWRGDEPKPRPRSIFGTLFGGQPPLTPEDKAEIAADIQRRRGIAAARSLLLSALNLAAICPKCGKGKAAVYFCCGGTSDSKVYAECFLDTAGLEHLHRTCRRCSFVWYEKPLDAVAQ